MQITWKLRIISKCVKKEDGIMLRREVLAVVVNDV